MFELGHREKLCLAAFITLVGLIAVFIAIWGMISFWVALLFAGAIWLIIGLVGINATVEKDDLPYR